jgi:hypothetical protein
LSSNSRVKPTAEEIISTLKRSSLPTVVVEGDDDIIVYRRLEEAFSDLEISVIPAGGRETVLKIFERLNEIPNSSAIVFIADKDTWVFDGIPTPYQSHHIIFTDGYSIENDLYRDKNWRGVLVGPERERYQNDLERFLYWYALAVSRKLRGAAAELDIYPGVVIDDQKGTKNLTALEPTEVYPEGLLETIKSDYGKFVRGHSLVGVLSLQISAKGRKPQVNHQVLLEIAASDKGPLLSRIYAEIERFFSPPASSLA